MTIGVKDSTTKTKVNYHCHSKLDQIPNVVNELWNDGFTVDKMTWDSMNGLFRIDYFEMVK